MTRTTDLQEVPGVGPRMQEVLEDLGVHRVADLRGRDPGEMYLTLCAPGEYVDRCVLYSFRCAVYYAETDRPDRELLKWWNWKDRPHANERAPA